MLNYLLVHNVFWINKCPKKVYMYFTCKQIYWLTNVNQLRDSNSVIEMLLSKLLHSVIQYMPQF